MTETQVASVYAGRYRLLDCIRGVVLVSMIAYHAVWDLVNMFDMDWLWYDSDGMLAYLWQQSICWTFIILSGFCWPLGKRPLRNGVILVAAGALVSFVTRVVLPEQPIQFGVLTLLGSCMLLMVPLERMLKRIPAQIGLMASLLLFVFIRDVNNGFLGIGRWQMIELPCEWYHGTAAAFLGFMPEDFISVDYFSLLPWLFLFLTGYFLQRSVSAAGLLSSPVFQRGCKPLDYMGRHSLLIYLLHQLILYMIFSVWISYIL